jgi:tRNA G10  N-methylase Trm11
MAKYNDLDMSHWRQYEDIYTDSLWMIDKRDSSGAHSGHYHGNFVPQIPNQLFRRYTKKGDWILDPFMGSGTSMIEAHRLGRNAVGIELQEAVAQESYQRIVSEKQDFPKSRIRIGDSRTEDLASLMEEEKIKNFQFVIFHPPYWDIIHFSERNDDLSNTQTLESFLEEFGKVIDNTTKHLEKDRYCAVVIGDKYANGEITPLGFHCMNLFLQRNFKMKAILVKNFEDTKGKSNQKSLWRYRALAADFYIFKHEYIFVFKKVK